MKIYSEIKSIEMADDENIYEVVCEKMCPRFENDLNDYYEGDLEQALNEGSMFKSAEESIIGSGDLMVVGYGCNSGKKLWQLPPHMQLKIIPLVKGFEL